MTVRHVLINGWFAEETGTGSGQYLQHMLDALPAVSPATRWTVATPRPVASARWRDVETVTLATPPLPGALRKVWWEQVSVPRAASRLAADVLWTPYWSSPILCTVPTVVTIHDLIPLLLDEYRGGLRQRAYTALVGKSARRATRIITVSEASARDVVAHLGIPEERVTPIWHGPNLARSEGAPKTGDVRAKYNLPERYFFYMGGFDVRKNLASTLAAYARYLALGGDPDIRLVVGGRLPEHDSTFAPDPARMAQDMGIAAQVDLIGWVEEVDKAAIYEGATAFVFPSLYEGFGMPVLEAMQAGAPVITSGRAPAPAQGAPPVQAPQ